MAISNNILNIVKNTDPNIIIKATRLGYVPIPKRIR